MKTLYIKRTLENSLETLRKSCRNHGFGGAGPEVEDRSAIVVILVSSTLDYRPNPHLRSSTTPENGSENPLPQNVANARSTLEEFCEEHPVTCTQGSFGLPKPKKAFGRSRGAITEAHRGRRRGNLPHRV